MHPWKNFRKSAATTPAPEKSRDTRPRTPENSSEPQPWRPITVDVPGPLFEARPPGSDAFHPPDTECDGWSTSELTLRVASVRGANHRYYRRPRQDSARAAVHEPTGTIVFAVADGVSSAANAELGALEVCGISVCQMLHSLTQDTESIDFYEIAYHSAERLHELARWRLGLPDPTPAQVAQQFATTLVAGMVRPDPDGPIAELFRIGDSGAWIFDRADGRYSPLFDPKTAGEVDIVPTEVTALPYMPEPPWRPTTARLSPTQILLVGTDGFSDPLGDGDGLVGALFARHLTTPPPPVWLAHVLDFSRETFDDDRTLLAVWPRPDDD